jgi:hypothetical protein
LDEAVLDVQSAPGIEQVLADTVNAVAKFADGNAAA